MSKAVTDTQMQNGFNPAYVRARAAILNAVPETARCILDIGCATGAAGEELKKRGVQTMVWGIELDAGMTEVARGKLDRVFLRKVCRNRT